MTLQINIRSVRLDDFDFIFEALQQIHLNLDKDIFLENFKTKTKNKKSWIFIAENIGSQKIRVHNLREYAFYSF